MPIVDMHLDLAYNHFRGRNLLRPAVEQQPTDGEFPTVGLPDLQAGGINLIGATIFAMPAVDGRRGYTTAEEASRDASRQLQWYQEQCDKGHFAIARSAADLPTHSSVADTKIRLLLLMEGADPLRTPDDLPGWFDAGLRIVGLAWRNTRFAGGTFSPGPLTPTGIEIIPHLDRLGIIHDASHLADESFWQLLERTSGPIMASHSNCRTIVPADRQITDEMIRAIIERGGVIGLNFYDQFLLPPEEYGKRRATLKDLIRHADHICQIAGNAKHVAIGTDMDGGLGRYEIPEELITAADLPKVGDAFLAAGYPADDVNGIMSGNWLRFFAKSLPR